MIGIFILGLLGTIPYKIEDAEMRRFDLVQHLASLEEVETQRCEVTSPESHSRVSGEAVSGKELSC